MPTVALEDFLSHDEGEESVVNKGLGADRISERNSTGKFEKKISAPGQKEGWAALFQEIPSGGGPFGGRDNALTQLIGLLRAKAVPYEAAVTFVEWWDQTYCSPSIASESGGDFLYNRVSRAWAEWAEGEMPDLTPEDFMDSKPDEWEVLSAADILQRVKEGGRGVNWIVPNLLIRGGIHVMTAPAAGAKSWVAVDAARCLTQGGKWLGTYEMPTGKVLYLDEEMGLDLMGTRMEKLGFEMQDNFLYLDRVGARIDENTSLAKIISIIREKAIDFAVFDTITRFHRFDENDNNKLRIIHEKLKQVGACRGVENPVTILFLHHDRKGGNGDGAVLHERLRGGGDWAAIVDMGYGIDKKNGLFHFSTIKNRAVPEDDLVDLWFEIKDNEERTHTDINPVDRAAVAERGVKDLEERITDVLSEKGPLNVTDLRMHIPASPNNIQLALQNLRKAGIAVEEKVGRAKVWSLAEYEEGLESGIFGGGKPEEMEVDGE